jgi:hypothetical protein
MRMKLSHSLEQTTGSGDRLRFVGEYQRDLLTAARHFGQPLLRQIWIAETLDSIVMRVPLVQLTLENTKGLLIFVERE